MRPATVKRYRENIVNILGAIPARLVSQLTAQTILQFRRERLESGSSPRTVNMDVGALSMMLNWGVAQEMIAGNPLAKIKPLPTDEKRKQRRPLTVEEVQAIFDASQERLRPVWRMFATTGIRHDELTKMRFVDVDFERATVTVRSSTAKNHREREIPLDDEMLATIQALQDDALDRRPIPGRTPEGSVSRDHVFVTGANTPWRNNLLRAFYAVCRRAGIEGAHRNGSVDLHSLRVTFATLTLENGASPKAVQMMLGHATLAMTMTVYAKATERSKRAALNALPFAKASDPGHIIPMQSAHTMRTRRKIAAQPVAG